MHTPPKLPRQSNTRTAARNEFLRCFHNKILADSQLHIQMVGAPAPKTCPLLMDFVFENSHEMKIACTPDFLFKSIEALCKPWQWHELSPTLAHFALDHVLQEKSLHLPKALRFNDFSLNEKPVHTLSLHHHCVVRGATKQKWVFDIWTAENFPFANLAQQLNLKENEGSTYPAALYLTLPVHMGAARLPTSEIANLAEGDVILINEGSNNNAA